MGEKLLTSLGKPKAATLGRLNPAWMMVVPLYPTLPQLIYSVPSLNPRGNVKIFFEKSYSLVKGMVVYSGESPITLFVHSSARECQQPAGPAMMIFCKQALLKL